MHEVEAPGTAVGVREGLETLATPDQRDHARVACVFTAVRLAFGLCGLGRGSGSRRS